MDMNTRETAIDTDPAPQADEDRTFERGDQRGANGPSGWVWGDDLPSWWRNV
jgi:hypothetical protein